MTIADRIKKRREELELTQDQLAKKMGYAMRTTVSNVESMGDDVTLKKVKMFAKALNVPEAYLLGIDDEEPGVYSDADLEFLDKFKLLTSSNQLRIKSLVDLFSNVDDIHYAVDTDILDVYISEEEKRKATKIKMIKAMKAD